MPFAPLSENHLVFTDSNMSFSVDFIGSLDSSKRYNEGNSFFSGAIKPEVNFKNTIRLQPDQHITITTNIATYYDFKKYYLKGIHEFKGKYIIYMPYVKSGTHIFENQEYIIEKKPVYLILTSGNSLDSSDDTFKHFIIP